MIRAEQRRHALETPTASTGLESEPTAAARDGLSGFALTLAAISIAIGMVCANLDMAIVQNALPAMSIELHISSADSVWLITSYMLVTLTLLLPFAPLSDRIGYRRFYLGGFVVFIAASLLCGLANAFWQLQLGRICQGIGSAAMMCATTSLLRIVYPKRLLAKAIGSNSTLVAASIAAAPSLSAFILLRLSWHWLFLLNVPLGVIAFVAGYRSLPATPAQLPGLCNKDAVAQWVRTIIDVDWVSVVLNIVFFTLLLLGTERVPLAPGQGLTMLAVAAIVGSAFVRRQIKDPHPMLPFDLLRERNYAFTIATSFGSFAAQGAAFVSLPFYLQRTAGFDPKHTAMVLTAWPLALAAAAQLASRMTARVPVSALCGTGQLAMAVGLGAVAVHLVPMTLPALMGALALAGAGFGCFQSPNNYVIVAAAPPHRSGSVGALRAATRTCGQLLGSAFCGLVFLIAHTVNDTAAASIAGAAQARSVDGASLGVGLAATMALFASICSFSRKTPQKPH